MVWDPVPPPDLTPWPKLVRKLDAGEDGDQWLCQGLVHERNHRSRLENVLPTRIQDELGNGQILTSLKTLRKDVTAGSIKVNGQVVRGDVGMQESSSI